MFTLLRERFYKVLKFILQLVLLPEDERKHDKRYFIKGGTYILDIDYPNKILTIGESHQEEHNVYTK